MSTVEVTGKSIRSTIPARLDRLSWSPFHTRMVMGLGAAWILDGLQITIASSVTGVLVQPDTLDMTSTQVGMIASVYLIGQVVGALVFGRLSDQLGRKRLLIVTLLLYLFGTGLDPVTAEREQWDDGNNTLALAPRLAVAYERNTETNARLEEAGIEVIAIAGSELGSGRGGPRCMSCPVLRDTLPAVG